ncbi:MAG: redoxin domain-containing protein, partial [Acidiferrobacterales bacterium]|nr:redoxin domain-containing protein [Acidiferrobacterales bacterium]
MNQPTPKPAAGEVLPTFSVQDLEGNSIEVGNPTGKWMLLVIYRGKHCGRCKMYLNNLETMQAEWSEAGFDILVASADPATKVQQDLTEFGWTFPIACELQESDMHRLGLYVSDPLTPDETDRRFAEPG